MVEDMNAFEVHELRRIYRAKMGLMGRKVKQVVAVDSISLLRSTARWIPTMVITLRLLAIPGLVRG